MTKDTMTDDETHLRELATQTLAEIAAMREKVAADGYTLAASSSQPVPHPLLKEIRAHQQEYQRLMAALNAPEPTSARQAARALARTRWDKARPPIVPVEKRTFVPAAQNGS